MSRTLARLLLFCLLALAACTTPRAPGPSAGDCQLIHVSSNGWHTRLHLPAHAFDAHGPLRRAYPEARWLSIGWGERAAYPNRLTLARALTAIGWPTRSVLHVTPHGGDPQTAYRLGWQSLAVSGDGLSHLAAAVERDLAPDAFGAPVFVAPGLDGATSAFFEARPSYHVFNTCNVWMARHLGAAGVPVGWPDRHLFASSLMAQLGRHALPACPGADTGRIAGEAG